MYFSSVTIAPTHAMNHHFTEGFYSGCYDIKKRITLFKEPLKANIVIEALGIYHRSLNDRFELISPHAMIRKLGYLQGVFHATITTISTLNGSPVFLSVVNLTAKYCECMTRVINSDFSKQLSILNGR